MIESKWQADPTRGKEFLEPRRQEIVSALEEAADAAFYALDEKLASDIEALKRAVGEKKAKITKTVEDARTRPVMDVIRKYWNETPALTRRLLIISCETPTSAAMARRVLPD